MYLQKDRVELMKEYEMTDEQYKRIMEASQPVPYIVANGTEPKSPQERANAAWSALALELGFKAYTVQGVPGKSNRFFAAQPIR